MTSAAQIDVTKNNLSFNVRGLPKGMEVTFKLDYGYSLISNKEVYEVSGDLEISEGRVFELRKDDVTVLSFKHNDKGKSDAIENGDTPEYRKPLAEAITPYLLEHEGQTATSWILKRFIGEAKDVPPWERNQPTRKTDSMTLKEMELSLNEEANATRFEEECNSYLAYSVDEKRWIAWKVNYWADADEEKLVIPSARFVANTLNAELSHWEKEEIRLEMLAADENKGSALASGAKKEYEKTKQLVNSIKKFVNASKSERSLNAMVNICRESTMIVNLGEKSDVNLIAFKNGILDTKEGKLYSLAEAEQFRSKYPVHYVDCNYIKNATPKVFNEHLLTIFTDKNPDLSEEEVKTRRVQLGRYFLRLLGYSLIAGNPEQIFVFLWGRGRNGKSTTMTAIRNVLGKEFAKAPVAELYATSQNTPAERISKGLWARILYFAEGSDSKKCAGGKICRESVNELSGETSTDRFRKMRDGGKEQKILCLPIAATNDLPSFDEEIGFATIRRLVTIPFNHTFSDEELDDSIEEKLLAEKDEIFSIMVDQAIAYRHGDKTREGMSEPGLLPLPDFCKTTQAELLSGAKYSAFIDTIYLKTDGKNPLERTFKDTIAQEFIMWCNQHDIECNVAKKPSSKLDKWGYPIEVLRLTKAESTALYRAFRAKGFGDSNSSGKEYICCKKKS